MVYHHLAGTSLKPSLLLLESLKVSIKIGIEGNGKLGDGEEFDDLGGRSVADLPFNTLLAMTLRGLFYAPYEIFVNGGCIYIAYSVLLREF